MLLPPETNAVVPMQLSKLRTNRTGVHPVTTKARVLIVDDNVPSAKQLADRLAREGCLCEVALSRDIAQRVVQSLACDVVICDVRVNDAFDFELLKQFKALQPNLPVIAVAADISIADAVEARKHGAFQYVDRSLDIPGLLDVIVQATVDSYRYRRTPTQPPGADLGVVTGELEHTSLTMRELVESIALVARSSTPILILGESGTGKERVARAIHASGPRASQPFVAINASAIPEQLLESEIFGHVRGAFTGATQARRGLLQEASGGTLLLDEIADMPLMLQPKLLRVLQFGEVRPVGSDRSSHVDVRVIAATHRDLSSLAREGRFREDLLFRLNVIPLLVPPLRARRQDIMPLTARFLQEAQARTPTSPVNAFSDEAMDLLTHAAWPGNVRELEHAIERLVVLGRESVVTAADLAFLEAKPPIGSWPSIDDAPWTLKQMNQRYLRWVLARTNGDKVRAAKILNVNLSTLYRWEHAKR